MEPISIVTSALGYIFKAVAQTKTAKTAENELVGGFWKWLRPHMIKDVPEIETKPGKAATHKKTKAKLEELSNNAQFMEELKQHIEELKKAGIREINIVEADLDNIDDVHIGNERTSPDGGYDRENVFKGKASNIKTFHVGNKN